MHSLCVNASKIYTITVNSGFLGFDKAVLPLIRGKNIAVITDSTVDKLYPDAVVNLFKDYNVIKIVLPSGEQSKNTQNFLQIINTLAKNNFVRNDTVVAFGGGMVGDISAFVASTYMRGITLIAMPTTLLSSVDSSVGGKTAVNLDYGKNLLGTFYQPDAVFINTEFLSTLPERELKSGYGEVIKYCFLDSSVKKDDLNFTNIESLIVKCLSIKAKIVEHDEKESGERKLLNLGHTVGHAVEQLCDYKVSHGECVIKGLNAVITMSKNYFGLTEDFVSKSKDLLRFLDYDLNLLYDTDKIIEQMKIDKKSKGDTVDVVLLKDVGTPVIVNLTFTKIKELLN